MIKLLKLTILSFIFVINLVTRDNLFGQKILWQTCVGGSAMDYANNYEIAKDGCYLVVGMSRSYDIDGLQRENGDPDILAFKMNSKGAVLWKRNFGGKFTDEAKDVKVTNDGGFFIVGSTDSEEFTKGKKDFYVIRIDALGTKLWEKSYGGPMNDAATACLLLSDGSLIVAGESGSIDGMITNPKGGIDMWVIRISPWGNLMWQKSFGGSKNEYVTGLCLTAEEDILLVGPTDSKDGDAAGANGGKTDVLAICIDKNGSIKWKKTFGGNGFDEPYSVCTSLDGTFNIVGTSNSTSGALTCNKGNNDIFLIKLTNTGDLKWVKCYGGSGDDGANSIYETWERFLLVTGTSKSKDGDLMESKGGADAWAFKLDPEGNLIWQKSIGGRDNDQFNTIKEIPSGDYVMTGFTSSSDGDLTRVEKRGGSDFWVVCLEDPETPKIRSITPTTISGYIRDKKTKKFIEAEVQVIDNKRNTKIGSVKSDSTFGTYQIFLPDSNEASIGIYAPGYMFYGTNYKISDEQRYSEIRSDIELEPIEPGVTGKLFNITFETGRATIRPESYPELNRVLEFLRRNPLVKIQVNGHTDNTGDPTTKLKLSQMRADAVKNYLVEKGVAASRLTTKGFGATLPIDDNDTEYGRQRNRRVEFEIISTK